MSSTSDYIPRSDSAFKPWTAKFLKHATLLVDTLGIHATDLDDLEKLNDSFVTAFDIADDPETRTTSAIMNKNAARKALESEVRAFVKQYVTGNRALTDANRNDLGVTVHSTSRTPLPSPTTIPEALTDSSKLRHLGIHYRDGGKDTTAKPPGVHGVEIGYALLKSPPTKMADLLHSVFDTRSPYIFEFDEDQRGQTLYFALRWENTRGEKGMWSEIYSAIVP